MPSLESWNPRKSTLLLAKVHLDNFRDMFDDWSLLNNCSIHSRCYENVELKITISSMYARILFVGSPARLMSIIR